MNDHLHKADCPLKLLQEARKIINDFPNLEPFYTDGSKRNNITGSGVFSRLMTRGYRLPNNYTVFDAEIFAIHKTIEFVI